MAHPSARQSNFALLQQGRYYSWIFAQSEGFALQCTGLSWNRLSKLNVLVLMYGEGTTQRQLVHSTDKLGAFVILLHMSAALCAAGQECCSSEGDI